MTKKTNGPRSSWEAVGDVEVPDWYPSTTEGEISLPTLSEELLEASGLEDVSLPSGERKTAVWRPDQVREDRKLRARLAYAKRKRKRIGRPRKYKTYWQRLNAKKDEKWREYHLGVCGKTPWDRWLFSWKANKITDIRLTPEEFNSMIHSVGGMVEVKRVRVYKKIVSRETLMFIGFDGSVLYRGTSVPESYRK